MVKIFFFLVKNLLPHLQVLAFPCTVHAAGDSVPAGWSLNLSFGFFFFVVEISGVLYYESYGNYVNLFLKTSSIGRNNPK